MIAPLFVSVPSPAGEYRKTFKVRKPSDSDAQPSENSLRPSATLQTLLTILRNEQRNSTTRFESTKEDLEESGWQFERDRRDRRDN